MRKCFLSLLFVILFASPVFASGFGVFTQGASGLGQANAVVAHPTGASSLYFNPALLNDVAGSRLEVGTTGVYADRSIKLDSGGSEESKDGWKFPSTTYFTHQVNEKLSTGFGLFFPFGLSTEWNENYEGRYLGTYGDITTLNINPVLAYRVTNKLSLAAGFSILYLDATLNKKINQVAAHTIFDGIVPGGLPALSSTADISQRFEGEGWGHGVNLGLLYRASDMVSIGASYRSHIDVMVHGRAKFTDVDPALTMFVPDTGGQADIRLPAQAAAGIAVTPTGSLVVEVGVRWEDWSSTKQLKVELDSQVLGQNSDIVPRDWKATWSYNLGGQYRISEALAVNAGYLFGENAVPDATFEPMIPDTDAHLFTVGVDWLIAPWTISTAFGYEHHESRRKNNSLADPLGSGLSANGTYDSDIYLVGLSFGYRF